jgi:hypothetical protein
MQNGNKIKSVLKKKSVSSIYNEQKNKSVNKEIRKRAKVRFKESLEPEKTGVYPKRFKTAAVLDAQSNFETFSNCSSDSVYSDEDIASSSQDSNYSSLNMASPGKILDKSENLIDNRKHERKFVQKVGESNNFLHQFDLQKFDVHGPPSSQNAVGNIIGVNAGVKRMEQERLLFLNQGISEFNENNDMTYGITDRRDFVHNNMQPNFKSKGAGSSLRGEHAGETFQRKMETFTGSLNRPDFQHKKEQSPLFNPATNITNTFGTPVMTDYYQDRFIPSKEQRNVLPFEQIKVGPGLGLGVNNPGGNFIKGAGDPYRVLPRTVDDLRAKNKPKLTYEGRIVEGQKGSKGTVIGRQVQNKQVVKFKENCDDDLQKTFNFNTHAPKISGEIDPMTMGGANRGLKATNYVGPAKNDIEKATSDNMRGKYKATTRQSFLEAEPRNIHLVEGLRAQANYNTYVPDATQRGKKNEYNGPLGTNETNKGYIYDIVGNVPDANMRNVHDKFDRTGVAITGEQRVKYFDPNDVPDPNMRNVHDKLDRNGTAITGEQRVKYFNPNDVPDVNMRNVHDKLDRNGTAITGEQRVKYFDPSDVPDANMRNIHNKLDRNGKAIVGDKQVGKTIDFNDVPDVNMRNIHNKFDRNGKAIIGDRQVGKAIDFNDVPDVNMRNIHNKFDRNGKAITGDRQVGKTIDFNDIPDITMREIHSKTDRTGKAITGDKQKGKYIDFNDVPDVTMREIHAKTDRTGKAITGDKQKGKYVDFNDVPDVTMREIHAKTDRAGKAVTGDKKGTRTIDFNDVPDITMREIHAKTDRAGKAVTGDKQKGKYIDFSDVPDVTQREITGETNHIGPALRVDTKEVRSRHDAWNSKVNITRELLSKGRTPTQISYNRGPTTMFTDYRLKCEQKESDYMAGPALLNQSLNRIPFIFQNVKNPTVFENKRNDDKLPQRAMEGNPYIIQGLGIV